MTLAEYRALLGLSQDDVAAALETTRGAIAHWEHGRCLPSLDRALALQRWSQGAVPVEVWGEVRHGD